jgi:hypothetical protein
VGGAAGAGNEYLNAALVRRLGVFVHCAGGTVGREHAHLVVDPEVVEHVGGVFHYGEVRVAPHGNAYGGGVGRHKSRAIGEGAVRRETAFKARWRWPPFRRAFAHWHGARPGP